MRAGGNETPSIKAINTKLLTNKSLTPSEEALRKHLAEVEKEASLRNAQASKKGGLSRHGQVSPGF